MVCSAAGHRTYRIKTHNPSVAGSSPARPTIEIAGQGLLEGFGFGPGDMCPAVVPHWKSDRTAAEASQSLKRTSSVTYVQTTLACGLLRHSVVKPGIWKCVSILRMSKRTLRLPAVRDPHPFRRDAAVVDRSQGGAGGRDAARG